VHGVTGHGDDRFEFVIAARAKRADHGGLLTGRGGTLCGAAVAVALLAGCSGDYSTLDAAGPSAERFVTLTVVLTVGSAVILAAVMALALYAFRENRRGRGLAEGSFVGGLGLGFPTVVLLALLVYALLLSDAWVGRNRTADLTVDAVAAQWGWTFSYPELPGAPSSENVLHLPAGGRVAFRVTSTDVIHSFWIPRLGGKIDAVPGRINTIALEADAPGVMGGLCAEFCGVGHSLMDFEVQVHEPDRFMAALAALEEA